MRVIAGRARGIPLKTIEGLRTRPTIDRVKESLFNILMPRLQEAMLLDCFSGSGSLCIEGLSRGAAGAVLLEENPQAVRIIQENLQKTKLAPLAKVIRGDSRRSLAALHEQGLTFDIIFIDPPHRSGLGAEVMEILDHLQLLNDRGIIVAEHHAREEYPLRICSFLRYDQRVYGNTAISFYRRNDHETHLPGIL